MILWVLGVCRKGLWEGFQGLIPGELKGLPRSPRRCEDILEKLHLTEIMKSLKI